MNDKDHFRKQPEPLRLTDQQQEVLDILRKHETDKYRVGDWYLGALCAIDNHNNPDRFSQAAQSLRELIEKLPNVVQDSDIHVHNTNFKELRRNLSTRFSKDAARYEESWKGKQIDLQLDTTLRDFSTYLKLSQQPTRKEQIQIAVRKIDPMAGHMGRNIQNLKRDRLFEVLKKLEDYAHHGGRGENIEQEFILCVENLEQLLFDLLAPVTAQDQAKILSILDQTEHTDTDFKSLYKLITRRGANYVFFFSQVKDPKWIPSLRAKKIFKQPPDAELLSDGFIQFPSWPELKYLKRVSSSAPDDVVDIVLQLPAVNNPRMYDDIIDIALSLHGERSAKLKPKIIEYAHLRYHLLPHKFSELLVHWTSENQTQAALELAELLVQFHPDPQAEEKFVRHTENPDDDISTLLIPKPRLPEWDYIEILNKSICPLADKEPHQVAVMLIKAVSTMICLGMHQKELDSSTSSDPSEIWCPRLDKQSDEEGDSEETLILTMVYASKKVFGADSIEMTSAINNELRNQRWDVFKRVREYLYSLYPNEQTKPWIRELIRGYSDYEKGWRYPYEFQLMLRRSCEHFGNALLENDERTCVFDLILSGPSLEIYREWAGDQFSQAEFEQWIPEYHRLQLRPFASVLFGKYANYYEKIKSANNGNDVTDESYSSDRSLSGGVFTYRSPKSPEELSALSDEKLLEYINEWQDEHSYKDEWTIRVNVPALASAFQSVFTNSIIPDKNRLAFWIGENRIRIRRPIFVQHMIQAMHNHVEAGNLERLNLWLDFCNWIVSSHPDEDREPSIRYSGRLREDESWRSSRRAVVDFVGVCLKEEVKAPVIVRNEIATLLEIICTQFDWGLDRRWNENDPLTDAINSKRGRGLENLLRFGYWVRTHDDKANVPEITSVLEQRLHAGTESPLTTPEYALLGKHYLSICWFDMDWAVRHRTDFFPQEKLDAWQAAFENLLFANVPHPDVLEILRDEVEFALGHLDCLRGRRIPGREITDVLGEHLFRYYTYDVYSLRGKDSLLGRFYQNTKTKTQCWAKLFDHVGRLLRNTDKPLEDTLMKKVQDFFEWRLEVAEPEELREFTFWLDARCLEAEWRLDAYSRILEVPRVLYTKFGETQRAYIHVKSLSGLLLQHPAQVISCFAKLVQTIPNTDLIYIPVDQAKAILRTGFDHEDENIRKTAENAREDLLRGGQPGFLDLAE